MENQIRYGSVLDGKLMFGDPYNCPDQVDIIVSTLSDYDEKHEFDIDQSKLRKFPMRPGFEPEYFRLFEALLAELDEALMQGKRVYIFDPDGTERAVLIAWKTLVRNTRCRNRVCFGLINEAYQNRINKPIKFANSIVPRFFRQLEFGNIYPRGGYKQFTKRTAHEKRIYDRNAKESNFKRRKRTCGSIRLGVIVPREESDQYMDPFIRGYMTIRLIETSNGVWHGLSAINLGPIELNFVTMFGSHISELSYCLNNAFFSLWVFPEHLDGDKPNADFFDLHARMVGALKPMKKHPLYMRKMPHHPGRLPKFLYWQGELIPFREAKIYIYSALYRHLVRKTRVFRDLENTLNSGANILLLDYDAVEFTELGMTYEEYMDDEKMPWTDAHILYGMLKNEMPWLIEDILDGAVISKT
jgi:hypothetical protein